MNKILFPVQQLYLENLRKEENSLILEMEDFAKVKKIPILDWQAADFLEQLIQIHNPKRVLEIGTAIAYSSIRIARNLRKKGIVYTIELSKDNATLAKENIAKSGLEEKINLIEGNALTILPKLGKKFDFIFLDADKEDYQRLFDFAIILLRKNGVIFIDNLLWHGLTASPRVPASYKNSTGHIREFNKMFMNQPNLKTTIIPVGDGIGLGIKIK
ncbi:MAG: O-methyltransferase [Ignavibacteriales bacterium]|nr:O-methyltransferase [Ignavibacteriales bacterium]